MSEPTVLFVKPKAISQRDKKALAGAGVIVVEIEDVNAAKLVRPYAELSGSQMLSCAAKAIGDASDYTKAAFAKALCAALQAQLNP